MEFGGQVKMTTEHNSGTERCNELAQNLEEKFDVVINIQGDEPCINPEQISQLATLFSYEDTTITTLAKQIKTADELLDENTVKVIFDENNFAVNFSRFPIPEPKSFDVEKWFVMNKFYKHIGIYGYRAKVLQEICKLQPTKKELSEKLEQLRWLENGYKIKVGITAFESISIDVPKDIEKLNL
jgi:3-deoxy-manno-octulosonate cytidylyltransferase (CMP-KDO synthetase)